MIFGTHNVGDVTVRAPRSIEYTEGGAPLLVIETHDVLPEGRPVGISDPLSRADVELLRELCDEALS